jgi:hypothetical protein
METRTPARHDDVISIARWEGEGGARKSPVEEERDTRDASSRTNHDKVRVPPPPRNAIAYRTIDVREVAVLSEPFRNAPSPSPQSADQ